MSGVKLANPTFSAGPQDDLAVTDVYKQNNTAVVNSIQELNQNSKEGVTGSMRGGPEASSKLSDLAKTGQEAKLPTEKSMLDRLKAGGSSAWSSIKSTSASIKNSITSAMPMVGSTRDKVSNTQDSITNKISTVTKTAQSVTSTVRDGQGQIDDAKRQVNSLKTQVQSTKSRVTDSITGAKNAVSSATQVVSKLTGRSNASKAQSYPNGVSGGHVYVSVNGELSRITSSNLETYSDLAKVMNSVKGQNLLNVSDKEATAAVLAGLLKNASDNHIRGAFNIITSDITDPVILNNIVALSLPTLLRNGDFNNVYQITQRMGAGIVLLLNKDALTELSKGYTENVKLTVSQRLMRYAEISQTFAAIDPHWSAVIRHPSTGDVEALNLTALQAGSADFNETIVVGALSTTNPSEKFYATAGMFSVTNVEAELKKSFPMTVIGSDLRADTLSLDPRSLAS